MKLTFIPPQAGYSQQCTFNEYFFIVALTLVILFFVAKVLFQWYCKIKDLEDQETQITLLQQQNALLKELTGSFYPTKGE